ncbi:hypothetical protein ACFVVA_32405, partial [Kitasatospora sp. NPDC058048]|uniref:hypothetical protein n=1 Tax=Kitasatospora sp. NPDC058048 TaxID=3346313 RepID=UPI0036DD0011
PDEAAAPGRPAVGARPSAVDHRLSVVVGAGNPTGPTLREPPAVLDARMIRRRRATLAAARR